MEQDWILLHEKKVSTGEDGFTGHLCWTADQRPVCPVCGSIWPLGAEAAWTEIGSLDQDGVPIVTPSYGICFGCNTEFGNDDTFSNEDRSLNDVWAALRHRWLNNL